MIRLAGGASMAEACRVLGLREPTVRGWLTRGRKDGSGEYADFARAVESARASAVVRPAAMDEAELAIVVSERAREGVVSALELRWKMLTKPVDEAVKDDDVLSEVDELARRRRPA